MSFSKSRTILIENGNFRRERFSESEGLKLSSPFTKPGPDAPFPGSYQTKSQGFTGSICFAHGKSNLRSVSVKHIF